MWKNGDQQEGIFFDLWFLIRHFSGCKEKNGENSHSGPVPKRRSSAKKKSHPLETTLSSIIGTYVMFFNFILFLIYSWRLAILRGGYYGNGKFLLRDFITVYYGLWRILRGTDITGLFLRFLLTWNPKSPRNSNIWKNPGKIEPIYYRYYGILRILQKSLSWNLTVRNISPGNTVWTEPFLWTGRGGNGLCNLSTSQSVPYYPLGGKGIGFPLPGLDGSSPTEIFFFMVIRTKISYPNNLTRMAAKSSHPGAWPGPRTKVNLEGQHCGANFAS